MLARTVTALMLSVALLIPAPAHAVGDFDPPVTVIDPGCDNATVVADAVGGPDGKVYGFARFSGAGCTHDIWYFEGAGSTWTSEVSPYRGRLLAVTHDGTATYLLYTDGRNTRITKRTTAGVFTPGRVLGGDTYGGDVVADDGKWWATWFEGETVYQAKTLGRALLRRRVVDLTDAVSYSPGPEIHRLALAHRPGGGVVLFAECCGAAGKDEEFSALTVQVSADGDWIRRFDVGGYPSSGIYEGPQVATDGRVTWLAWTHDGQIQITRNRTGRFVQRDFMVNGFDPRLVASDGRAFAAWTSFHSPARVFLAEEAPDGAWTGTWVSPVTTRHHRLAALAATGGKATVLIMTPTHLYARSQP